MIIRADQAMQNQGNKTNSNEMEHDNANNDKRKNGVDEEDKDEDEDDDEDDGMNYLYQNDEVISIYYLFKTNVLYFLSFKLAANGTLDKLITEFKSKDEYDHFKNIVVRIRSVNDAGFKEIVSSMPIAKQEYLKQVLQSQRVVIDAKENKTVARKIVKVRGVKDNKKI